MMKPGKPQRKVFMILRGINFGPVFQASGATNFYGPGRGRGHGWWYHKPLHFFGLDFSGSTTVTKTTMFLARAGNMPLKKDGVTPKEWIPRCIIVNRAKRIALNAVSLSGPGLEFLISSGEWQKLLAPFWISVMSLAKTAAGRMAELEGIFHRLAAAKKDETWHASWGVQVNESCPNGGLDPNDLIDEAVPVLEMADRILPETVPLMLKFGPEVHPKSILKIAKAPRCDGICVFNTLPFGKYPTWARETLPVDWYELFGTADPAESPMAKRFPGFAGGLSGAPLKPFLFEWLRTVRALGVQTPIVAGGGLLSANDAALAFEAGADAVSLGSIAMLAPRQVRPMIRFAHQYAARRQRRPVTVRALEYFEY